MKTNHVTRLIICLILFAVFSFASDAGVNGVNRLIAVTQMKVTNANDEVTRSEKAWNAKATRSIKERLAALRVSLAEIKDTDPTAEQRVLEIDRKLASLLKEIQSAKETPAQPTPTAAPAELKQPKPVAPPNDPLARRHTKVP